MITVTVTEPFQGEVMRLLTNQEKNDLIAYLS